MTRSDLPLAIREAVVGWLRAAAPLAGVPAANIYGEQPKALPPWPFIRFDSTRWENWEDSCSEGVTGPLLISAFAKGPGTDDAYKIAAAISDRLTIFEPVTMKIIECDFVRTQVMRDGAEADKFHAIVEFNLTVIST